MGSCRADQLAPARMVWVSRGLGQRVSTQTRTKQISSEERLIPQSGRRQQSPGQGVPGGQEAREGHRRMHRLRTAGTAAGPLCSPGTRWAWPSALHQAALSLDPQSRGRGGDGDGAYLSGRSRLTELQAGEAGESLEGPACRELCARSGEPRFTHEQALRSLHTQGNEA